MKLFISFLSLVFFFVVSTGCNNTKEEKTEAGSEQKQVENKAEPETVQGDLIAPGFSDPELKQYYHGYTEYLKNVVSAIRNKDENAAMTLFTNEGKKYNNAVEIEARAKAADEQKFNTWLMQTMPYQQEIVKSEYYKKFNEEYYKKVKEDFKKKNL